MKAFVTTAAFLLLLQVSASPPRILTVAPENQTVALGQAIAILAIADGTPPLVYHWRKYGVPIAGATASQLVIPSAAYSDAGLYSIEVSNAEGLVTSRDVVVSVNPAPPNGLIKYQPTSRSVVLHQPVCLDLVARGTPAPSYQWTKNGIAIVGATNDYLYFPLAQLSDAGLYSVIVSSAGDTATSSTAELKINLPMSGDLDYSFAPHSSFDGEIRCAIVQPDGRVLVGGYFSTVQGAFRGAIARLNPDGKTDPSFMNGLSGANYWVNAMALQDDGKIIIGGYFIVVNGKIRHSIARLNPDGTLDQAFQNNLSGTSDDSTSGGGEVDALAIESDGKIVMGGHFAKVNGVTRNSVARLNADGTLDSTFQNGGSGVDDAGTLGTVASLVVQSDGKIIIGGVFSSVGGQPRASLARLAADGSLDPDFKYGAGEPVDDIVINTVALQPDGKIIVGGAFSSIAGADRKNIARLNADGSLDRDFQKVSSSISASNSLVTSIALLPNGKVLIGGQFDQVNPASRTNIARLNADGTPDASFQVAGVAGSSPSALALQNDGGIIVVGDFFAINRVPRKKIGRIKSDGTLDTAFVNEIPAEDSVWIYSTSLQSDGKVLVGGAGGAARLNPDGSLDATFRSALGGTFPSLAIEGDSKILAGGSFVEKISGVQINGIARFNADGSIDSGFSHPCNGSFVSTVVPQKNSKFLVGGLSICANGDRRNGLARLNSDGSLDRGFADIFRDSIIATVSSIAVQRDGKIIIAGGFTSVAGVNRTNLTRLNEDGTFDSTFRMAPSGVNGIVNALTIQNDGKILLGGKFTGVDGGSRTNIARLNADGTLDTGFLTNLLGANDEVNAVALQADGKVILGGEFTRINGTLRYGIARLNTNGTLDDTFLNKLSGPKNAPGAGPTAVYALAVQPDGNIIVAGQFTRMNDIPCSNIARLWANPPALFDGVDGISLSSAHGVTLKVRIGAAMRARLQYKANLNDSAWIDFAGDVSPNPSGGSTAIIDSTIGGADRRFYRLFQLP